MNNQHPLSQQDHYPQSMFKLAFRAKRNEYDISDNPARNLARCTGEDDLSALQATPLRAARLRSVGEI